MSKLRITMLLFSLCSTLVLTGCPALEILNEWESSESKLNFEIGPEPVDVSSAQDEKSGVQVQQVRNDESGGFGAWLNRMIGRSKDTGVEEKGSSKNEDASQDHNTDERNKNSIADEQAKQTKNTQDGESDAVVDAAEKPGKSVAPSESPAPVNKPSGIKYYMDELEADLRRRLSGSKVNVIRSGHNLTLNIQNKILFQSRSYVLGDSGKVIVKSLADIMKKYQSISVEIAGHTDNQGLDSRNQLLSQQRAESIAAFFSAQGLDDKRIYAEGYGERRPIASNMDENGRAQNRRIEISFYPDLQR